MQRTFFYVKRPWLIALTSMFVSFLCCQPPRWVGAVAGEISSSVSVDHIGYIATAILMYYILQKYVVESARHLMERSVKACLLFGAMPAIFYLFDYFSSVYTNFLYSGTRAAVQFMPFVTSAFWGSLRRLLGQSSTARRICNGISVNDRRASAASPYDFTPHFGVP
jgi:two-component system sensor histidine kinase AgrC